jgi:hypothetical protein
LSDRARTDRAGICRAAFPGLLIALLGLARPASAQSDGTYCVGSSYLAYELARPQTYDSLHGVSSARHTLQVISIAGDGAIGPTRTVALPPFTVHGLQCLPEQVRILGWDSLYTVPYSAAGTLGPIASTVAPWAGQGASRPPFPGFSDSTLWHGWDQQAVDTVLLPLTAAHARWALTITAIESDPARCRFRVTARLVRFATAHRPRASRTVYDDDLAGECGE